MSKPNPIRAELRPYSKKELANLYKVTTHCLTTMLEPFQALIGKKRGWYYNVNQVKIIFASLGYPDDFLPDDYTSEKNAA